MSDRKKSRVEIEQAALNKGVQQRTREALGRSRRDVKLTDEDLVEAFKDFENIAVAERRLDDPNLPGSLPIRLKDEPQEHEDPRGTRRRWYLRWINLAMPNRHHIAQQSLGYAPVKWDELQNVNAVVNPFKGSDDVRRGDGGKEALMKMPMALYKRIKAKQHEKHARTMTGRALKDQAIAAAHARGLNPEEAEEVGEIVGGIKVGRERLVSNEATEDEVEAAVEARES